MKYIVYREGFKSQGATFMYRDVAQGCAGALRSAYPGCRVIVERVRDA